jgi:hypothetical protein
MIAFLPDLRGFPFCQAGIRAPLVWQMSSLQARWAAEESNEFQIVSPADGMSLPVHPRDFGIFPRQLCHNNRYYATVLRLTKLWRHISRP